MKSIPNIKYQNDDKTWAYKHTKSKTITKIMKLKRYQFIEEEIKKIHSQKQIAKIKIDNKSNR